MAITFNQIPILLRTPGAYTEYDGSRAIQGLSALPNRILVLGCRLDAAGEATTNVLYQILNKTDGARLFGRASQLDHMLDKLKRANSFTEVWAVALADAGTASTWTLTVTGTATQDGVLHLLLGGRKVDVEVAEGDDQDAVAAAIEAAVDADPDLAFTAASADEVATLTSRHTGAFTASLDVRVNYFDRESFPPGISVAIATGVVGATNPTAQTALDALPEDMHFTTIISGWSDTTNMAALETEAELRWGPLVQQDQMVIAGVSGSFGTMSSYGGARNSQFSSVMGSGLSPTPPYEWAAVYGAVEAFEPDPARPRQTLWLPNLLAPARTARLGQSERNLLLQNGISTFTVDQGGKVYIERAITTYQTNATGQEDVTYLDITTMRTLAALRYTLNARIRLKYPRHKLASDGTLVGPGQPIVTPSVIKGEIIALFGLWADQGWVERGSLEQFKRELTVERNASDVNRVDALIPPDLMNQFVVFAGQIQFLL